MEPEFHTPSNGTGLKPKFVRSQRESSKQVDIQNLPNNFITSLPGLKPKLQVPEQRSRMLCLADFFSSVKYSCEVIILEHFDKK
jgi:hypothetical protein